jgi:hypothetical protein
MKESTKKKLDSIDKSKIKVQESKDLLAKIEKALSNDKNEENQAKAEKLLDVFIAKAKAKNADIFKTEAPAKPKTPAQKKQVAQSTKSKLDSVMDTIANNPLFKDFNSARRSKGGGKSDPLIDSERKARESGRRVSQKGWSNQYGKSKGGRRYYEYRENRIDRKAPTYGDRPWLEDGGMIHPSDKFEQKYSVIEIKGDGSRRVHNTFPDFETAMVFASLKRNVMPSNTRIIVEDEKGTTMYRSFKSGGEVDESTAMVLSQNKAIAHHTKELKNAISKNEKVEPWVIGKMQRASTDMSDVTHYFDGMTEYAQGGRIKGDTLENVRKDAKTLSRNSKEDVYVLEEKRFEFLNGNDKSVVTQYTTATQEDVDYIKAMVHNRLVVSFKILGKYSNGELKSSEQEVLFVNRSIMADGGEVEFSASRKADNPNITNEELRKDYNDAKFNLSEFRSGNLKPSKVIGGGYKSSSVAKQLAEEYLEKQVAIYKTALMKRGVMEDGGYMAKGGNISTWDKAVYKYLEGEDIFIYSMGVKQPMIYKIKNVKPPNPNYSIPTLVLELTLGEERIVGKEKIEDFMSGKQIELYDGKEYYAIKLASMAKSTPKSDDYANRRNVKLIVIKNPNKNGSKNYLTIDKRDFLNGLHKFEEGGSLSKGYTYIKRADVNQVVYRDSNNKETIEFKPKNGFWVSKKALVDAGMNETKAEPKKLDFGTTSMRKTSSGWIAKNKLSDYMGYDWEITTMKSMRGDLVSTAVGGKNEKSGSGYTMFTYVMYQDPNVRLITSKPSRITEKVTLEQQEKALKEFETKVTDKWYAKGGEIGFEGLSKKVANNYEGKKVDPKYQDEYGKTYNKKEAKEVGNRVAAKVYKQQLAKMEHGGELPEDLGRYFVKTRGTKVISMSNIIPLRARPEGIANAEKYMKMAYDGKMDKRKPITVYKSQRSYRVYDGNSTFAVAKANGWENIWANVMKNPNMNTYDKRGVDIFTRAKQIRKEGEAWKDALQRAKGMK